MHMYHILLVVCRSTRCTQHCSHAPLSVQVHTNEVINYALSISYPTATHMPTIHRSALFEKRHTILNPIPIRLAR